MAVQDWRILLVEDDPDGQELAQRILRHHGIQFDAAMDAESALELLNQHQYTAAVLDLALPVMDGWGLLKRIRTNPATAQLLCFAVTSFHSSEVAAQAVKNGFTAYFQKPLEPFSFVRDITRFIEAT